MNQSRKSSTFAVRDTALRKVVWSKLHRNRIAGDDTNEMFPHLTSDVRYNLMAVFKLYSKLSTREGLDDGSRQFDYFFTCCHKYTADISRSTSGVSESMLSLLPWHLPYNKG